MKQGKQRKRQRFLAVVMAVVFVVSNVTVGLASPTGGIVQITDFSGGNGAGTNAAETIYFGSFWQNTTATTDAEKAKLSNYTKQGIKWRVLANDATNGVLLLSDQGLYADQFNSTAEQGHNWNDSDIRKTLNGTGATPEKTTFKGDGNVDVWGSFAGDAFDAKELGAIKETAVETYGQVSQDKLFLLSGKVDWEEETCDGEVRNTDYGFTEPESLYEVNDSLKATATVLAQKVVMYGNATEGGGVSLADANWWLRSPGSSDGLAFGVYGGGLVDEDNVYIDLTAVRPALNLDPSKVLFLTAANATQGKSSVTAGNGFTLANVDTTAATFDGWKVTLKDADNITAPTGVTVTQEKTGGVDQMAQAASAGNTIDLTNGVEVTYGNPTVIATATALSEAKADYVSAILEDATEGSTTNGQYVQYAKVSSDASTLASGVTVDISKVDGTNKPYLANGTYKMYVFAEKTNGEKETDYASELVEAGTIHKSNGTAMEDKLSFSADKAVTFKLGNSFNLSFESGEYMAGVTVDANQTGIITADASNGTTLKGDVIVKDNATLNMNNAFTLAGNLFANNNSTLYCDNLTLAENGFVNMNDMDWDGSSREFRTLNVSGNYFGAADGFFVINTDLAHDSGDVINLNNTTVSGTAKVQVAYDPTAVSGQSVTGTHKHTFLKLGTAGQSITITGDSCVYDKNGKNITITPTVEEGTEDGKQVWKITALTVSGGGSSGGGGGDGDNVSDTTKSIADTANAINLAWLQNISNLQKRLGDLRSGEASNTGWARFQRSLDDLNNGRKLNVSGNLYQIGYDFALNDGTQNRSYFGLSLERMDGNQSFDIGGGDLKSTSLGVYYTKIYESGHYFDFIFRYGRYESDTTSYNSATTNHELTKLAYAENGVTLSGEYGYRWNFGKSGLYLEPQAEFIYGYLSGAKKTSSTNTLADIDSRNHFITRWGVAMGQRVKNFNYYARASYYHDFAGTTDITYGASSYKLDSAKNWWEVSVGGGWNLTDTSYFYAELTKHFKDVSNSINFNLGFRFTL